MSDNKQIIPFSSRKEIERFESKSIMWLSKRGLIEKPLIGQLYTMPRKTDKAIMKDKEDLTAQLAYYEEMIKDLQGELVNKESSIESLKKALNSLSEKSKYISALESFREMFMMNCISFNIKKTIFQCNESIKRNQCTFHKECTDRKNVLDRLKI